MNQHSCLLQNDNNMVFFFYYFRFQFNIENKSWFSHLFDADGWTMHNVWCTMAVSIVTELAYLCTESIQIRMVQNVQWNAQIGYFNIPVCHNGVCAFSHVRLLYVIFVVQGARWRFLWNLTIWLLKTRS